MNQTKIFLKDPADLSVHPLAKLMPEWTKEDPRFAALVEDVRERGLDQALLVDGEGRILDGRQRWRAVRQLQWSEVECRLVPENQMVGAILNSLLQRRHCTKGQLAYLTFPLLATALEEAKRRRLENLRKGQQTPDSASNALSGKRAEDFAESIGVCRRSFFQAKDLHKHFENPKKFAWNDERRDLTLKEYYEPRILAAEDPAGLGAVLAGIGAKLSGNTTDQATNTQLHLFEEVCKTTRTRFLYWDDFSDAERLKAKIAIQNLAASMPDDLREEFMDALRRARKERAA